MANDLKERSTGRTVDDNDKSNYAQKKLDLVDYVRARYGLPAQDITIDVIPPQRFTSIEEVSQSLAINESKVIDITPKLDHKESKVFSDLVTERARKKAA